MREVVTRVIPPALALIVAVALGVTLRAALPGAEVRATATAVLVVLALAPCIAAALHDPSLARRARALHALGAVLLAGVTCAAALLAAGGPPSSLGAALVPAGLAALALGTATLVRSLGAAPAASTLAGAGLCAVLAGGMFVADAWIEWNGATASSTRRSAVVYRASPIAAALSHRGGVGLDWQRSRLLYDGLSGGGGGLSLVGQYYPVDPPPSPWAFGLGSAVVGCCLLLVAPVRSAVARSETANS